MKHFHIYDTCGEVMCVDADSWDFSDAAGKKDQVAIWFWTSEKPVAYFNWSNVVCVREEEDDDEGEVAPVPPVLDWALN